MTNRTTQASRAVLAATVLALASLLAAACGGSTPVETGTSDSTEQSVPAETDHGGDHDTDHGGEDNDDKDDKDDKEDDGDHEHGVSMVDVPANGAPEIDIAVTEAEAGFVVDVQLANFTLTEPDVAEEYVAGEGHMHVYVDGVKIGRYYETSIALDPLPAGEHTIEVEINASDHSAIAVDGVPIRASQTVTVAEGNGVEATTADNVVNVTYEGGEVVVENSTVEVDAGSVVEVRVTSDAVEHVHVHGYDLFGDLTPGNELVLSFTADIPGVFEVELEDSGKHLFDLQVR